MSRGNSFCHKGNNNKARHMQKYSALYFHFIMDIIVRRFPILAVSIFNNLDDQSLVKFKEADRESCEFIILERFYWIKILKRYSEHFETSKKSWNISISKTPAGFVKKLAMTVLTYFKEVADPENEESDPENDQLTPLDIAAYDGDVNFFQQVKEKTFDQNQTLSQLDTSINLAAYKGNIALCRHLMNESEDKNFNKDGENPLLYSVFSGHLEVFKLFHAVAEVKNPKLKDGPLEGWTLLHIAAHSGHSEICKVIIQSEDNKNPANNDERTPLHIAIRRGHLDICSMIIDNITDKNPAIKNGWTALHCAAFHGQLDIYKLIAQKIVDKNPRNRGHSPLHIAAFGGHLDLCKFILENVANQSPKCRCGETPLHLAAKQGHFDICKLMFGYVDEKNPASDSGDTPLHYAALSRNDLDSFPTPIRNDVCGEHFDGGGDGYLNVCKLILANIDDINPKNKEGRTPMDIAKKRNQVYIIQSFRLAAIQTKVGD